MGSGRFNSSDWKSYATASCYDSKSTAEIFNKSSIDAELDPKGVKLRESRDSADNPNSNAIIIGLDVTGSMGIIADTLARKGLPTLMTNIYEKKPVTDPHVMCMGIGDAECDSAPLQVSQFEADLRISKQLEKIYLEHGGGGNSYESYALAWYFAAHHTVIDCFEKRGKKGYLFTIGDEKPTPYLLKEGIESVTGDIIQVDKIEMSDLLTLASRQWEIFHLIIEEGDYARRNKDAVVKAWTDILGQRALRVSDHTKVAEVIVSAIQIAEGVDHDTVLKGWDGNTALVVKDATKDLSVSGTSNGGVVTL